jgi:hypothetical protein
MFAWKNHGRCLDRIDGWWNDFVPPENDSRVRFPEPCSSTSLAKQAVIGTALGYLALDSAFALHSAPILEQPRAVAMQPIRVWSAGCAGISYSHPRKVREGWCTLFLFCQRDQNQATPTLGRPRRRIQIIFKAFRGNARPLSDLDQTTFSGSLYSNVRRPRDADLRATAALLPGLRERGACSSPGR